MLDYRKRVWAEIDLDAIERNLSSIKKTVKSAEIIAVVKADGYGHGAISIAKQLSMLGVNYFAVSCLREAIELRNAGICGKILILGYTHPEEIEAVCDYNLSQSVFSLQYAKELSQELKNSNKNINIHIKLNTGMNRLGFNCVSDLPLEELTDTLNLPHLCFEGLFTHFACSDCDKAFTDLQYERFVLVKSALEKNGFCPRISHCCNSAGTLLEESKHLDAVRTGIILYGLTPDKDLKLPIDLYPAMSFKAVVASIHKIKPHEGVSYGLTFKADKEISAATVTVGYADGYPRFLSGCGEVLIKGKRCPILGRVCMDQIVVDISNIADVKSGDEVVLIGKSGNETVTADQIASIGNTINYEIVCGISRRVPRYYIKGGKITAVSDYIFKEGGV